MKKENLFVILTGVVIGIAALVLTALGNPANMGFCIACFERDIAGAVGLHSAAKVQYVRPEIIGLVLGSFLMALASKEWKARAGSSSALRFVLGAFVMIGALAFLGCPASIQPISAPPSASPNLSTNRVPAKLMPVRRLPLHHSP